MNTVESPSDATIERAERAMGLLLEPDEPWVLACSGGSDSIALVVLASSWARQGRFAPPIVVHANHHLRPDSGTDARVVADVCARLGLTAHVLDLDGDAIRTHPAGIEGGARALRYNAIVEQANALNICSVATAHHARDHLETLLMRMGEGTGIAGIGGPAEARDWQGVRLIRPLLNCWPDELATVWQAAGVACAQDPTNADTRFRRNAIRHLIVPTIEKLLPREPLRRSLGQLREDAALFEALLAERMAACLVSESEGRTTLDRHALAACPERLRRAMLLRWMRATSPGRIDARFVSATSQRLAEPGPAVMMGNRTRVEITREQLLIGATGNPRVPLTTDDVPGG
jgi:tRNA(Ile)-lysidine synthase